MNKPKSREIIIQHPYFGFDPQNYQIYREDYTLKYPSNQLILEFARLSEINMNLSEDEILWHGTGYWSVLDNRFQYIGRGEAALLDTIKNITHGKLAFCLNYRDAVIFIKSTILQGKINNKSVIDIYCTNSFLPFVEVLDPFRKTLKMMGQVRLNISKKNSF